VLCIIFDNKVEIQLVSL